jgi:hypothetical protein
MTDLVVRPRIRPDANPKVVRRPYYTTFRLVADDAGVAVIDVKERRHPFPPAASILAYLEVEEGASGGNYGPSADWESKNLVLADENHHVLWRSNGDSFDRDELSVFATAAGLSFETGSYYGNDKVENVYPGYKKAIWIAWTTRSCAKTAVVLASVGLAAVLGVARPFR